MAWNQNFNEFAALDYDNAVEIPSLKQLDELTLLICQACRICSVVGHATNMCPMLREESYEQVNTTSAFPGQPQMNYDSCLNTYNSEWMDHHNFSYGNPRVHQLGNSNFSDYQQYNHSYSHQQQGQSSNFDMSLEDMFKTFMTNTLQFQQETSASIQNLTIQMAQIEVAVRQLKTQDVEELPSYTVMDQLDDESEIMLENGDDMPMVEEVVEQIDNKNLEDAVDNSLGLHEEEEIESNQNMKEAETTLNSLPVILDNNAIFSFPLPVTHNKFLSSILQDSIPQLQLLANYINYLFIEEGVKPSYEAKMRCNLPMKDNVMDGVLKIHEIGVT